MEQWFIEEWRSERDANRAFREDVVERLTALETRDALDDQDSANTHARWPAWIGVVVGLCALLVSLLALL